MFGYNITTLVIILAIALLLFGPRRLPELGDSIGKAIRSFKKANEDPDAISPRVEIPTQAAAAPQAFTCSQCHKDYQGDVNFCPHCGQRVMKG
jgi:sec-independent protein translocase protein TatA